MWINDKIRLLDKISKDNEKKTKNNDTIIPN